MAKKIDITLILIITFVLTFFWSGYLVGSIAWAAVISLSLTVLVGVILHKHSQRNNKPYTADRLLTEFVVRGNDYALGVIRDAFGLSNSEQMSIENGVMCGSGITIVAAFKLSPLSQSDVISIYNRVKDLSAKEIWALTGSIERKSYAILSSIPIHIRFVKIGAIYRYLQKNHALPKLETTKKRYALKEYFSSMFNRKMLKYYVLSGIFMLLTSFIVPYKIYYLTMGSVSLALSLICLFPKRYTNGDDGNLFKQIAAMRNDSKENQNNVDDLPSDNEDALQDRKSTDDATESESTDISKKPKIEDAKNTVEKSDLDNSRRSNDSGSFDLDNSHNNSDGSISSDSSNSSDSKSEK